MFKKGNLYNNELTFNQYVTLPVQDMKFFVALF